ncbi:carboxylate-amine ligase [Nocardioides albertanoniae]|uniref:Putative glutamate--cysteine ligase 2 n=1 Tax=Nocardioides albertanoniae TaxID=1175486 RepID=A0A543ACF6_9ACTN|nr:glutamate--cysteine ligase [Nocardioides albertanoniae]TQL70262.1 carboxylate-amine ligase [Nocardioides albertanoniae]
MRIDFHPSPRPTLGLEWELALVDRRTRDLVNVADHLFARAKARVPHPERIHRELLRNTVEVVTGVCETVEEAIDQVRETTTGVAAAGDDLGVDLFGAGTHPFASWTTQELTAGHRYAELIDRTQWWGRQMLIWGVHVHVGLPERDRILPVLNGLLTYYPHFQALSASSPIWAGLDTGYASNRALMFQQLPTAGLPFQFTTWEEFEAYVSDQTTTGVIDDISEIRWDIRPSPKIGTIENRICDGVSTLQELAAIAALAHCLCVDLDARIAAGEPVATMPAWHVQENKWRAARYGLDAIVILNDASEERLVTDDLADLLLRLEPVAARLGCEKELAGVRDIIDKGASYQRQRAIASSTGGDLVAVVDSVVRDLRGSL